jgi:hypothetical protein
VGTVSTPSGHSQCSQWARSSHSGTLSSRWGYCHYSLGHCEGSQRAGRLAHKRARCGPAEYRPHLLAALCGLLLGRRCRRCSVRRCATPEPSGCHALIQIECARRRTCWISGIRGSGSVVLETRNVGGRDSAWHTTGCSGGCGGGKQMSVVGSFGSFRRAVHMIGCAGADCSSVARRPLGRLRLARRTRRALQIQTM